MSARDLFGGYPPPFKFPAALGAPGQMLTPTGTSSTLVWGNTTSGQLIDTGSGNIVPLTLGSGNTTFQYNTYKLDHSIVVDIYSTSGSITLTSPSELCITDTAVFAAYAPASVTGGAIAFSQPALTSQIGLSAWQVSPGGVFLLSPKDYVSGQPFTLLPCTLIWQSP